MQSVRAFGCHGTGYNQRGDRFGGSRSGRGFPSSGYRLSFRQLLES
jgi:hypothetical protein